MFWQAYPGFLFYCYQEAYFLQAAEEPLGLDYVRAKYGPYAEKVNFILQALEGHYILGYGDRTGQSAIYLLPEAIEPASSLLAEEADASERLNRVSRLIEGFETLYGMELLATVHWIAHEDKQAAADANAVIDKVGAWSARKQDLFTPEHISKAWARLQDEGWLPPADDGRLRADIPAV